MSALDRLVPWLRRAGWAYVGAACLFAVAAWRLAHRSSPSAQPKPTAVAAVRATSRAPAEFIVHVVGAVRRPGVYKMGGDTRVIQAVRMAGGPTPQAELSGINLAAPIQDGQQVVVPRRVPAAAAGTSPGAGGATGPVSLGSATPEQLEALDGIGPGLAARIVSWRKDHPFRSVDDLLQVPGIGPARLAALRDHVTP